MPKDDEVFAKVMLVIIAGSLAMIGISSLWLVASSAHQLLVPWLVFAFRILLFIVVVVIAVCLVKYLIQEAIAGLVDRIANLERDHHDILQKIGRRQPAIVNSALLIGQAVLLLADKTFEGEAVTTLTISTVLLIAFWVANELQISTGWLIRTAGFIVWFIALASLPAAAMVFYGWDIRTLWFHLRSFPFYILVYWAIATVVMLVLPFLTQALEDAS